MPDKIKTPLQHALDTHVLEIDRQKFLRLLHAGAQTCISRAALQEGRSNDDIAADSRCFGRLMLEIEAMLDTPPDPFTTPKQQRPVTLPMAPAEFERMKREAEARARQNQTATTTV